MATRQEWNRYLRGHYPELHKQTAAPDKATRVAIEIIAAIREYGPSREVIATRIREAYGNGE